MTEQTDYIPFGDEWRKEMSKWRKSDLIELVRTKLIAEKEAKNLSSNPMLSDSLFAFNSQLARYQDRLPSELKVQWNELLEKANNVR